ncbi:hemerythrin HHE cation binding domain-containing protein [Schizothecium vesticola]|uniref:Hemerythrin HHE cation binding domain-containing protein n=1 Tax=Schizothecium vesticola TaxID=314040 RepID=A0AA40BP25_9PEZI|nr:hemerythrin HHE cation binding domain-containing protein [Schizothecium vesticola]
MPAVYADHPFAVIPTPSFPRLKNGEPIDIFHRLATEMTLVHNLLLRSLNAIVLQAPHITGADILPFTRFILAWHTLISVHHAGEEELFFPAVERMTGVVGVMDKEKGEHEQFHAGLDALKGYVDAVVKGEEKWDGGRVVQVVEGFGGVLRGHLKGEIESLEGLRRFGEEKMKGVMKAAEEEAEAGMKALGGFGLAWAFQQIDYEFEEGTWKSWPAAPFPVKFIAQTVMGRIYADGLKYSACDRNGRLQPLYALRDKQ